VRDPDAWLNLDRDRVEVDGRIIGAEKKIYLMLNKPRGLVTTTSDEKGRETVYRCFAGRHFPWIAPVGRLDRASEGLLLFTNDNRWATQILAPESHIEKTYHVQVDTLADETLIRALLDGMRVDDDFLSAKRARILRQGERHSWLEIVLDEGKNRHIRRLVAALDLNVLRLVRVAIGSLALGNLPKGAYRELLRTEIDALVAQP
jgi:23S rRNA pseudouridine2605 synthase